MSLVTTSSRLSNAEICSGIAAFIDAIGEEATLALVLEFGGGIIYIAQRPSAASRVVSTIGKDAALRLAANIGGGYIKVPLARRWVAQHLHRQGASPRQIARRLLVSNETVRLYLRPKPAKGGKLP